MAHEKRREHENRSHAKPADRRQDAPANVGLDILPWNVDRSHRIPQVVDVLMQIRHRMKTRAGAGSGNGFAANSISSRCTAGELARKSSQFA